MMNNEVKIQESPVSYTQIYLEFTIAVVALLLTKRFHSVNIATYAQLFLEV